jgi:hypothetical protein
VNCGFFGGGCASVDTDVISDQLDLIVRLLQDRPAHRHLHAIHPIGGEPACTASGLPTADAPSVSGR